MDGGIEPLAGDPRLIPAWGRMWDDTEIVPVSREDGMFDRAIWQMNNERHSELVQVTAFRRAILSARAHRLSPQAYILVTLGKLVVSLGLRLRGRDQTAALSAAAQPQK